MSSAASIIQIAGLAKKKLHFLRARAKAAGTTAEIYARQLIEDGISLEQRARATTFDELYAPTQERFRNSGMMEEELDALVDTARTRLNRGSGTKA